MIDVQIPMPKAIINRKQGEQREMEFSRVHEIYWYEQPGVFCIVWFAMLYVPGMTYFGWRWRVQFPNGMTWESGPFQDCALAQMEAIKCAETGRL
jgi:hypothetical protein